MSSKLLLQPRTLLPVPRVSRFFLLKYMAVPLQLLRGNRVYSRQISRSGASATGTPPPLPYLLLVRVPTITTTSREFGRRLEVGPKYKVSNTRLFARPTIAK